MLTLPLSREMFTTRGLPDVVGVTDVEGVEVGGVVELNAVDSVVVGDVVDGVELVLGVVGVVVEDASVLDEVLLGVVLDVVEVGVDDVVELAVVVDEEVVD